MVPLALLVLGCRAAEDAKLAKEPINDEVVVATFPPDGALHLWGDVPVQAILGSEGVGAAVEVRLVRNEAPPVNLSCAPQLDGVLVRCDPIVGLQPGDVVSLDVQIGETPRHAESEGRLPEPGLGWSFLDGVAFTAVGGSAHAVEVFNAELGSAELFAALDGFDGGPGPWTFTISPSGTDPAGGQLGIAPWGFTFLIDVTLSGDRLEGQADTAWLAADLGQSVVLLLLLDVILEARLDGERLEDLSLSASLPAVALEELREGLGVLGFEVLQLIDLDLDLDGDGKPDSASLRLEGTPEPAALAAWAR